MNKYEQPALDNHNKNEQKKSNEQLTWEYGSATECGRRHAEQGKANEDIIATIGNNIFVCSDGAGGCENGKLASETVIRTLQEILKQHASTDGISATDAEHYLDQAFHTTNKEVKRLSQKTDLNPQASVSVIWKTNNGKNMVIGSVGNCQVFLERNGSIRPQCIEDVRGMHVDEKLDPRKKIQDVQQSIFSATSYSEIQTLLGEDGASFIANSPLAFEMTQLVGNKKRTFSPNLKTISVQNGDRIIMCSDGVASVTGGLNEQRMLEILHSNPNAQDAARSAIRSIDNVKDWRDPKGDDRSIFIINTKEALKKSEIIQPKKIVDTTSPWKETVPHSFEELTVLIKNQQWVDSDGTFIHTQRLEENIGHIRRCPSKDLKIFLTMVPEVIRGSNGNSVSLRQILTTMKLDEHNTSASARPPKETATVNSSRQNNTDEKPSSISLFKRFNHLMQELKDSKQTEKSLFEATLENIHSIKTLSDLHNALFLPHNSSGYWTSDSDGKKFSVQELQHAFHLMRDGKEQILPRSISAKVEGKKISLKLRSIAENLLNYQSNK
jgi:serine/threonine protein phosphatase PrpC